jgi:regulator of replication initiation timing
MNKEEILHRIKEIEAAILQQGQYVQQMNNQILMFHGAKEEYNMQLQRIEEKEKLEAAKKAEEEATAAAEEASKPAEDNGATQDNLNGEANNEEGI